MIFSLIGILGYACLRSGIYNLLRYRKHSRSFIKKHLEGKKRFWLYEKINKLSPLGIWYHFNKAYLIYASAYFVATLSLAHIDVLHIPFIILSAVFVLNGIEGRKGIRGYRYVFQVKTDAFRTLDGTRVEFLVIFEQYPSGSLPSFLRSAWADQRE